MRGQRGVVLGSGDVRSAVIFAEKTEPFVAFSVPAVPKMDIYILGLEPAKPYEVRVEGRGAVDKRRCAAGRKRATDHAARACS